MEKTVDIKIIKKQTQTAILELLEISKLEAGDIFVMGCSSSEIVGGDIGKKSSIEAAEAVFDVVYEILNEKGIYLAVQCCEHLNRALIIEQKCADQYSYDTVNVIPWQYAGGALATTAYARFFKPVAVEHIKAKAGIDVGDTLIGMHLKDVVVPVRLSVKKIGDANLVAARTRAKFIGGERARYY